MARVLEVVVVALFATTLLMAFVAVARRIARQSRGAS
jgi:hypothetical protein